VKKVEIIWIESIQNIFTQFQQFPDEQDELFFDDDHTAVADEYDSSPHAHEIIIRNQSFYSTIQNQVKFLLPCLTAETIDVWIEEQFSFIIERYVNCSVISTN
jgi:hypothetical protein